MKVQIVEKTCCCAGVFMMLEMMRSEADVGAGAPNPCQNCQHEMHAL